VQRIEKQNIFLESVNIIKFISPRKMWVLVMKLQILAILRKRRRYNA